MGRQTYFLGSNSANGFYSCYNHFCTPKKDNFLWVIKGGPGCGKSSFMRKIGEAAENAGLDVEYVICSGDPDSLDGVYIPEKQLGYVDGTAPHVIEASYPAAYSAYLDLGQFYDRKALMEHRENIVDTNRSYKTLYQKAYSQLASLPRITAPSHVPQQLDCRFHTAVSCKGIYSSMPSNPFITVTPEELTNKLNAATEKDVLYLHPLWPDVVWGIFCEEEGVIYQRALYVPPCTETIAILKQAKELHDELEKIYNPHVDFDGVYKIADQHIAKYL